MASKGRKAVSQEELRRLMKEKRSAAERQRRVQSPFARYTRAGRLECALCGEHVKIEAMWQAHVLGREHKERVAQLKQQGQEVSSVKRKKEEKEEEEEEEVVVVEKKKKKKEEEGVGKKSTDVEQSKTSAGLGLLAGQYGDDDDDEEQEEQAKVAASGGSQPAGLPTDFFESTLPQEEEKKAEPTLPEGFFDDPVKDARVRNVDTPREQMDREWEEFQKEMRLVNTASDAIVAEDDEEGRLERQIDEIDEQIECFRRVEVLRAKQEAVQGRTAKQNMQENPEDLEGVEGAEEDEEQLLHVLSRDWRAKGALA